MCRSIASWIVSLAACGCSLPQQRASFTSVDPQERSLAALEASQRTDPANVPALLQQLRSDDPAQRMLSIHALERTTGQTMGYDHSAPLAEREAAIRRWNEWYEQSHERGNDLPGVESPQRDPPS